MNTNDSGSSEIEYALVLTEYRYLYDVILLNKEGEGVAAIYNLM